MNWFHYVLIATCIYGLINFLYKISAEHKFPSSHLLNIQSFTVAIISLIILLTIKSKIINIKFLLLFAILNSFFFAAGTGLKMTALKFLPVNIVMPLNKFNSIFIVIIGIIFFKERPNFHQILGIILALLTLFLIAKPAGNKNNVKELHAKGILLVLLGTICIALSMTVGKLAAGSISKLNYIFMSYFLVFIYTSIIKRFSNSSSNSEYGVKLFTLGCILGVLNLTGYYCILKAWSTGPLSLIQGILSTTMIITIILARIFYNEKFTIKNVIGIFTSLAAVLLIKG